MKTIIDVVRAVSELAETLCGERPMTKDVREGYKRPCSWVEPTMVNTAREGTLRHDTYQIEIVREGTDTHRGWADLLHWQETLAQALAEPIKLDAEFFVYPEDIDFDISRDEMYLQATFTVDLYQIPPDPYAEVMEELELNGKD